MGCIVKYAWLGLPKFRKIWGVETSKLKFQGVETSKLFETQLMQWKKSLHPIAQQINLGTQLWFTWHGIPLQSNWRVYMNRYRIHGHVQKMSLLFACLAFAKISINWFTKTYIMNKWALEKFFVDIDKDILAESSRSISEFDYLTLLHSISWC